MSGKRYAEELKIEPVRQVTEGGYPVTEERDILKKPPRTLPRYPGEVRVYPRS